MKTNYRYYWSKAFKEKRDKMKTIVIKGMRYSDNRQITNYLYAHGELETKWCYDLVTAYKWGSFMLDVEDGIYDAKFILPDDTVVKAKVFIWQKGDFKLLGKNLMHGLVVKVGDDSAMEDAKRKYESKQVYI